MKISEELQETIKELFENNEDVRNKLLDGDPDMITEIGEISQQEMIKPSEIVEAYESDNDEIKKELYNKAKKVIELRKLYHKMVDEYNRGVIGDGEER